MGTRRGNCERAYFIAPHPTSMPAGQQVVALLGSGMAFLHTWRCGSAMSKIKRCEIEVEGCLGVKGCFRVKGCLGVQDVEIVNVLT